MYREFVQWDGCVLPADWAVVPAYLRLFSILEARFVDCNGHLQCRPDTKGAQAVMQLLHLSCNSAEQAAKASAHK